MSPPAATAAAGGEITDLHRPPPAEGNLLIELVRELLGTTRYEEDFLPAAAGLPPPPGRLRRCGISSEDAAFWRAEALVPMQVRTLD